MLTVKEAENIILQNLIHLETEEVSINDALGRVLAEDLCADRDFPPFDRVTMDGIAIQFEEINNESFEIEAISPAGIPQITLRNPKNCIEVMTGTMLPANTDTVIRYEDLEIKNNNARIIIPPLGQGANVHLKGYDRKQGDVIVPKGRLISAAEIGIAATIGKTFLKVIRKPKIVIISSGDEILLIDKTPLTHQIRTSNSYTLQAALKSWGFESDNVLLPDNQEIIEKSINDFLNKYDVLILSGGVSAGKFDFIPKALESQGVKQIFHKVSQRPGKPFWFGVFDSEFIAAFDYAQATMNSESKEIELNESENVSLFSLSSKSPVPERSRRQQRLRGQQRFVFALPGNPVSTFMCLNRYVKKWLEASLGIENPPFFVELAEDFTFKPDLTYFLQVRLQYNFDGKIIAKPVEGHGSGDLANLTDSDAFMELPKEKNEFKKGEVYQIWKF